MGTWNVRWINGIAKREEAEAVFKKRKFELLTLTETKLKGNGEVSWYGVDGIIAGVQEDVNVMNNEWHSAVIGFGCVSSMIVLVKFKFSRIKVCVVALLKGKLKKGRGSGTT